MPRKKGNGSILSNQSETKDEFTKGKRLIMLAWMGKIKGVLCFESEVLRERSR